MRPVFDTDVFIRYRDFITDDDIRRMALSVVVLFELTATTTSPADLKHYENLKRQYEKDKLLLVPTLSDWWECARAISRVRHGQKLASHGRTPRDPKAQRLQNDALIARTAQVSDCYVVTANVKDFRRLKPRLKFWLVSAEEYFR